MICILTLIMACGGRATPLLNTLFAATSIADTMTTQDKFDRCSTIPGCHTREINPLTRPFQSHGRTIAMGSTVVGIMAADYVASKMRTSKSWTRKVWWAPQVISIGASSWGMYATFRFPL